MIILRGDDNDVLSVRLEDILLYIEDTINWNLLWIKGVSVKGFDMISFEEEINNSFEGYFINSSKLIKLSNNFIQLIEVALIGDEDVRSICKLKSDSEMKERCEYFIELVDSSHWEITSSNKGFLKKIKENFAFEES